MVICGNGNRGRRPTASKSSRVFLIGTQLALTCLLSGGPARAQVGGVYVDPQGVLREASTLGDGARLEALRSEAADASPSRDVSAPSPLRRVSLRRLQDAVKSLHDQRQPLPSDICFLAGINRLQYLFFHPDEDDVVLAGPAEGWEQAPGGEVVGAKSRRPVLHLDDLLHALRYAFDDRPASPFLGCSIEPTAEGVKRHAAYMNGLQMDRGRLPEIFAGMENAMGPQAVKLYGVPESSRFALKLVAADYRLKRLALAHDPSPVPEVVNYLDLQAKRGVHAGPQRQHRWWFVAQYDAVHHTPDRLAWELEGTGVVVRTAPSMPGKPKSGGPKGANVKGAKNPAKEPQASPAAQQFATLATKHFARLAGRVPVFAELENVVALSVAAELIRERCDAAFAEKTDAAKGEAPADLYRFDHFLEEAECPTARVNVPRNIPSLTNSRFVDGRNWLISISGGVELNPREAARAEVRKETTRGPLAETRAVHRPDHARWWWDDGK